MTTPIIHSVEDRLRDEYARSEIKDLFEFFAVKLTHAVENERARLIGNHFCCKYQTIKREDFCDACLQALKDKKV